MGSEFTFYDYVGDQGDNVIHAWLQVMPKKVKVKFNKQIMYLEATPLGQWSRPYVAILAEDCAGLFEIRVKLGQEYRMMGTHMPGRKPTLLHCFIKPGKKVPTMECNRALSKKAQVTADPRKHRVEHNYE
ncbi:MAG: type II toxin-antitoxin system RelE/ParE family toxin [Dehalococcoidia bacterium]